MKGMCILAQHDETDCHADHEQIMAELKYHVHPEIHQLADAVVGPIIYGDERDTSKGLVAIGHDLQKGQAELREEVATIKKQAANGGLKVKLPWSFYGSLVAAVSALLVAWIQTH